MSPALAAIIAQAKPLVIESSPMTQEDASRARRSASTAANRTAKKAKKVAVLASVGGDDEKLTTIHVWVARTKREKILAKGYEKRFIGGKKADEEHDDKTAKAIVSIAPQDFEVEVDATFYVLEEQVIERARHPKEEVEYAKLQGRFREQTRSTDTFFAPAPTVVTRRKPTDYYAPLGDFNWCDDVIPAAERKIAHERGARRSRLAAYKDRSHDSSLSEIIRIPADDPTTHRVG